MKSIFKVFKLTVYYIAVIIICAYVGGLIAGEIIYKPSSYDLSKIEPKHGNVAEFKRSEMYLAGEFWGTIGGVFVAFGLRVVTDSKFKNKKSKVG